MLKPFRFVAVAAAVLLGLSVFGGAARAQGLVDDASDGVIDIPPLFTIECEAEWVERSNGAVGARFSRRYTIDVSGRRWWVFDANPRWESIDVSGEYLDYWRSEPPDFYRLSVDLITGDFEIYFRRGVATGLARGGCQQVSLQRPPGV